MTAQPAAACPPQPPAACPPRPAAPQPRLDVHLNIYDVQTPDDPTIIPRVNDVLIHCGMGVFHTGVQVGRREFAFGGHPDLESGIFEVTPRACPSVRYRKTLHLGCTALSEPQIDDIVDYLGRTDFIGNRYSLISRNCNTFSRAFSTLLGVSDNFPAWVNRLAGIALNVRCLLPEGVDMPLAESVPMATIKEPQRPPPIAIL